MFSEVFYAHISSQIESVIMQLFPFFYNSFFCVCVCYIDAFINVCLNKKNE